MQLRPSRVLRKLRAGKPAFSTKTNFGDPRIVEIKDIPIDAELGPNMLFIANKDQPGFIGSLGTILGDAGINIATFHLG
ncbi:MAG: phosphoglycerate dehydrogenase, partial [Victivallales bacterium]|nr:phosphoglycerate dehydrogenase [Victivallales bacterium]